MRWWRGAWLVGIVLGMGCFHIDCEPENKCPGNAVYPDDWNLSECDCPSITALSNIDGKDCTWQGLTCADQPYGPRYLCTCVRTPAGPTVWSCGERDMAVPAMPVRDLATVDDGGPVDGSVSD